MRRLCVWHRVLAAGAIVSAGAAIVFFIACGGGAMHPSELSADNSDGSTRVDATMYVPEAAPMPPADAPSEAPNPANGPPMLSVTEGDAGTASAVYFGDNGLVNCGSAADSVAISIENTGGGSLTWMATLSAGSMHYTLNPMSGTLRAGQTGTLQITPNPIPPESPVTTDLYGGIVTIATNAANDTTHILQLHQTARGAIINSTLGAMYMFGGVYVQQIAASQFSLTNTGNVAAEIMMATGSPAFAVVAPGGSGFPISLGPNATVAPQVTFTPAAAQTYTDTLIMSLVASDGGPAAVPCGPLPPNVTLTGNGTNNVKVNPTTLDFGFTNCGVTAAPQTLQITANGHSLNYMTSLAKGANTPFSLSPASGMVAAQATATITVTPKAIPFPSTTGANGFGDVLTISSDIAGDTPHVVTLNQTARGAILQFAPLTITTHDSTPGHYSFAGFAVQNAGNYEGTFLLGASPDGGADVVTSINAPQGTWASNLTSGNLIGGASSSATLTVRGPPRTTCGGGGLYTCGLASCTTTRTCASINANCGTMDDGCGGVATCGPATCPTLDGGIAQTCGGGGQNICGTATCSPSATCNGKCGPVSDGCGSTVMPVCPACAGTQFLGKITLNIEPNPDGLPTILCADAPPDLLLSDENP